MALPRYRRDLAFIHNEGFGHLARQAGPALLRAMRAAGIGEGRVVDLGCGGGIWLRQVSRAGYQAVGVDASAAMVRLARKQAPAARVSTGSAFDLKWSPCDAVTAIGEVLSYSTGRADHLSQLRRLFARIARALRPGGLLVFDLLVAGREPMHYRTWRAGAHWAVLVEVSEDRRRGVVYRDITSFRKAGAGYRRTRERHVVAVVSRTRVLQELRAAGFRAHTARAYGTTALAPRRLVFWARKPD